MLPIVAFALRSLGEARAAFIMQSSFSYEGSLHYDLDLVPRATSVLAIEPTRKRNKMLGAEKRLGMGSRFLVQRRRTALARLSLA